MKKPLKVLIVDDEPDIIEILRYNLVQEKYEVLKAYNGIEAVELAIKHLPDLIIMDIRMPEITGIEACRKIRLIDSLKNTPVLFLTADSDEYTTMNAFEAGGSHFITKPIRPSIIMNMIRELIN